MGAIRRAFSKALRRARITRYQRIRWREAKSGRALQDRAERRERGMPEGPFGNRWGPGGM
ncbi:MAG: hypothetical protein ACRDOY_13525 [Nocardioidaceae bacterium]